MVSGASASHPDDENLAAYLILAGIAMSTIPEACTSVTPGNCEFMDEARLIAAKMQARNSVNPAFLHYGLHAHDFPDANTYTSGLTFATEYPSKVNMTCHSLHMPSHLWDRAGEFHNARSSNKASISGGDAFASASFGALASVGGNVGSIKSWDPGHVVSGYGFAFDAGNLYHSLEYQAW